MKHSCAIRTSSNDASWFLSYAKAICRLEQTRWGFLIQWSEDLALLVHPVIIYHTGRPPHLHPHPNLVSFTNYKLSWMQVLLLVRLYCFSSRSLGVLTAVGKKVYKIVKGMKQHLLLMCFSSSAALESSVKFPILAFFTRKLRLMANTL